MTRFFPEASDPFSSFDLGTPPQPSPGETLGSRINRFGGPNGIETIPNEPSLGRALLCRGLATFSAVGPLPQAAADSAFAPGVKPANGTVAIAGANTFGFGRKSLRDGAASAVKIYPIGLDALLQRTGGPRPPYSVGDYGDKNIRSAPGARFDIYRFPTKAQAFQFGKQTVPVMIQVPAGGHCPPGTYPQWGSSVINALPPPEIVAHLAGPISTCVISLQRTDEGAGDVTSAQCGGRKYAIARDYHGDAVRRVSGCAVMLMVEGVRFPRLFRVRNCGGALQVRNVGDGWMRELAAAARVSASGVDRVLYVPLAHRPACYRVTIAFTPPGKPSSGPLAERSVVRCDRAVRGAS